MKIFKLKVQAMDGGVGVVLPGELLSRLKLTNSDSLTAVEPGEGVLLCLTTQRSTGAAGVGIDGPAPRDFLAQAKRE
jgi:antitoxin component of MazEF toxin-antitoxin module